MKQPKLQRMTVEQLVERFLTIALDQDRAIFDGDHAKYNRLYGQMDAIKQELKSRPADQRRALIPLHAHLNAPGSAEIRHRNTDVSARGSATYTSDHQR
jgi:hypothetical protein